MDDRYPTREHNVRKEIGLEVKNWTVHHPLYHEKIVDNNISFKVLKGEVVGFSALQGAGRTELAMSIFGKSYGTHIIIWFCITKRNKGIILRLIVTKEQNGWRE